MRRSHIFTSILLISCAPFSSSHRLNGVTSITELNNEDPRLIFISLLNSIIHLNEEKFEELKKMANLKNIDVASYVLNDRIKNGINENIIDSTKLSIQDMIRENIPLNLRESAIHLPKSHGIDCFLHTRTCAKGCRPTIQDVCKK
ncbi:hypothetical protein K1T71_013893 [Dendrolimus kikuchii]|uniref:Uncharacterized protein n=1 Tax=Dendrolimus kikuchii TaxID=765133 RepID=A0ACC1CG16_9NEOP|nr:hypothetical protein K1T71_013893 [Dendrolimus kikuchii]